MIVVTAPTSNIGRQVLQTILDAGEPIRVIARDPSKLPAETRERVEVVEGSHSEPEVVTRAFEGADAVFWLVPADPRAESAHAAYVEFARPGCEAFKKQGVKRVVGISALGRGWPNEAGYVSAALAMDDAIAATGVSYRALTCASFMDNVLRQAEPIKNQGVISWPSPPDLKMPTCATRDIAVIASSLLLDRSWSGVDSVPVLGPEDLSFRQMAQILSEALGKPVRFEEMPLDAMKAMVLSRGMSEGMARGMIQMLAAKKEGMDTMAPRTPASNTPTSFRQWCEEVLRPAISR